MNHRGTEGTERMLGLAFLLTVLLAAQAQQPIPLGFYRSATAAAASWVPTDESGLVVWHKADSFVGTNDNDRLGFWADSSANNYHAQQGTLAQCPYYLVNQINGKPAIRFFVGTNYFALSNVFSALTAAEVFMVIKLVEDPPALAANSGLWELSSDSADNHFPFTDSNVYDGFGSNSRKSTGNPSAALTDWRLYNVLAGANAWTSRVDTVVHFSSGANTVGFNTDPKLGNSASALTYGLNGWIAEFFVYDHILTQTVRNNAQSYLDTKYAMPGF